MTLPLVSLVMTTYNFAGFVAEAVRSLLGQETGHAFELIVVDDGSSDSTPKRAAEVAGGDPRFHLRARATNGGAASAINEGFAVARGKLIARLDGDDRWRTDFVEKTANALLARGELGLVYGDVRLIDAEGRAGEVISAAGSSLENDSFVRLLETNFVCAPAAMARRECWNEAMPWSVVSGPGDWLASLKMARRWPIEHIPAVLADYRVHRDGMHVSYLRDGSGERVVNSILDEMFALEPGRVRPRDRARLRAKHWLDLAFGNLDVGRHDDAKRLLFGAVRLWPRVLLRPSVRRQVFAAAIGFSRYAALKRRLFATKE